MIEPTIEYLTARVKDAEYTGEGRVEVAVPQLRALLADHAALTTTVRQLSAAGVDDALPEARGEVTAPLVKRCPTCRYAFDAKTWRCPRCAAELEPINGAGEPAREEQDDER